MFFSRCNYSCALSVAGALAFGLLLSNSAFGLKIGDGPQSPRSAAEILWDQFGIPHIYGPDLLTVVHGLGYAEMENHAETILMLFASARGLSAEYFGPGAGNANVNNDIAVRTVGIPARVLTWFATGGNEQAQILAAFTAGMNKYAASHGDTIDPSFRRVLPVLPADITAGIQYVVHFHFMLAEDNIPALISAWQTGGIPGANAVACSFTPGCSSSKTSARNRAQSGSNGWAISPQKARRETPF
jgi:acyl-homoserine lactone acylase PvdQ